MVRPSRLATAMAFISFMFWTRPIVRSVDSLGALLDRAAGHLEVLRLQRLGHVGHRQPVGPQLHRVEIRR